MFGTTYQKIAADNGIANPNLIFPGQVLVIK
jgi:nucleoid-associated protein YgaU